MASGLFKREVYLGIGSNLGDRQKNIEEALKRLSEFSELVASSSFIETKAWGNANLYDFLNVVVHLKTDLEPLLLLKRLKKVEMEMGRMQSNSTTYENRIIDLDILLYDRLIYDSEQLKIPHPFMTKRSFVLIPLLEINPMLKCPLNDKFYQDYLNE